MDEFDIEILQLLEKNGRLTNQELSNMIGLSPSQCSRRRIALEEKQLILGYHARLSPRALQQEIAAIIEIKLVNHEAEKTQQFLRFIEEEKTVVDAYKTTGDADYLVKVVVSDLDMLNDIVNRIFTTKLISHIKTSVVLERIKENRILTNS